MPTETVLREALNTGPAPFTDEFAGTSPSGRVDVIHGVYAHSLPLAGKTIKQARKELEVRMNIDPQAMAVIDGLETREDVVLREGQVLNFISPAGEKG
jgi:hypothetical protein